MRAACHFSYFDYIANTIILNGSASKSSFMQKYNNLLQKSLFTWLFMHSISRVVALRNNKSTDQVY